MFARIMRVGGRRATRVLAAALLALSIVGLPSAPASAAGNECAPLWHEAEVCVYVFNGNVYGAAQHYDPGYFTDVTVYVRQCRGNVTKCGTIAANHGINRRYLYTSTKGLGKNKSS